jgi:hypothetical protein
VCAGSSDSETKTSLFAEERVARRDSCQPNEVGVERASAESNDDFLILTTSEPTDVGRKTDGNRSTNLASPRQAPREEMGAVDDEQIIIKAAENSRAHRNRSNASRNSRVIPTSDGCTRTSSGKGAAPGRLSALGEIASERMLTRSE